MNDLQHGRSQWEHERRITFQKGAVRSMVVGKGSTDAGDPLNLGNVPMGGGGSSQRSMGPFNPRQASLHMHCAFKMFTAHLSDACSKCDSDKGASISCWHVAACEHS